MARASQIANKSQSGKHGKKSKPPHAEIKKKRPSSSSSSSANSGSKHRHREKEDKARRRQETKAKPAAPKPGRKSASSTSSKRATTRKPKKTIKKTKPRKTGEQKAASRARRATAIKRANVAAKNSKWVAEGRAVVKESTVRRIIRSGTEACRPTGNDRSDVRDMLAENAENVDIGRFEQGVVAACASYTKDALQTIAASSKHVMGHILVEALNNAVANGRTTITAYDFCNTSMSKVASVAATNVLLPDGLVKECAGLDARGMTLEEAAADGRAFVPMVGALAKDDDDDDDDDDAASVDVSAYGDAYERRGAMML